MKKQCKPVTKGNWLALLLSVLLLLGMLSVVPGVAAPSTGSLTVNLKADTFGRLKSVPEITLYQIGDADPSSKSGWSIYTEFSGYGILKATTPGELGDVAEKIAKDITKYDTHKVGTKDMTGGKARFNDLKLGVYFGMVTGVPPEVEVTPFIATIPARDPENKDKLLNDITVTVKDEWITSATVIKKWDDNNDQDGIRPEFIDVTLSNTNEKVRLDDSNNWEKTVDNLPMYANGQEIDYTWTEAKVNGYQSTQVKDGIVTTLTNVHVPETVDVTVRKVWKDEDNSYGTRPKSIDVTLSNGQKVTLSADNNWTASITKLPKYENGKLITYTWTEAKVEGYTLEPVPSPAIENGNEITTLTNVLVPTETPTTTPTETAPVETPPPTTQVTGKKIWVDDSNAHKTRPNAITVTLYADGAAVNATPTWTGTNQDTWTFTFSNLPAVNANGETIEYTVKEATVEGYESTVDGTTITNKLIPRETKEYKELTGHKTWQEVSANDVNTAAANRPTHIVVHLLRDGVEVETRTVTAVTNWEYSFGKQPMDDGYGNQYTYTLREDGVPGFFARIDGLDLINTSLVPPNNPPRTPRGDVPKRNTNTTPPPLAGKTEEEMDELMDMLDYNTPLWGQLLGTGDETPVYPYVFGGVGAAAIIALAVFGRKRKKKEK